MTTTAVPAPALVTGGTGRTGARPVRRPTARGVPVRIGSRRAAPPFDRQDSSAWARSLDREPTDFTAYATRTAATRICPAPTTRPVGS